MMPTLRNFSVNSKLATPRVPRYTVGRSARQPRAIAGDQHVGSERVAMGPTELGEPGRTGFLTHLDQPDDVEPNRPPRAASTAASAARLMLCCPLLSALPRPYQRSSRAASVHGSRPSHQRPSRPRTTSPWPYTSTVGRAGVFDATADQQRLRTGQRVVMHARPARRLPSATARSRRSGRRAMPPRAPGSRLSVRCATRRANVRSNEPLSNSRAAAARASARECMAWLASVGLAASCQRRGAHRMGTCAVPARYIGRPT